MFIPSKHYWGRNIIVGQTCPVVACREGQKQCTEQWPGNWMYAVIIKKLVPATPVTSGSRQCISSGYIKRSYFPPCSRACCGSDLHSGERSTSVRDGVAVDGDISRLG